MPSSTEKQRSFIFAKRSEYGSKEKTPEKDKWIWEKGWEQVESFKRERYQKFFEDRKMKKITVEYSDTEGEFEDLINYIKSNGNTGHSFSIIVDPESENKKEFGWDGDGLNFIKDIKVEKLKEAKNS